MRITLIVSLSLLSTAFVRPASAQRAADSVRVIVDCATDLPAAATGWQLHTAHWCHGDPTKRVMQVWDRAGSDIGRLMDAQVVAEEAMTRPLLERMRRLVLSDEATVRRFAALSVIAITYDHTVGFPPNDTLPVDWNPTIKDHARVPRDSVLGKRAAEILLEITSQRHSPDVQARAARLVQFWRIGAPR